MTLSDRSRLMDLINSTNDSRKLPRQFLTGKPDQVGGRDHGDVIEGKDPQGEIGPRKVYGDSGGNDGPEHVDDFGCGTRTSEADPQEVQRV